ncbi:MAG TPA: DNRLRE domain-containing protein [Syntrophomonadaceae bacterium]|nr:DNRLRE domain-containing protein [Syntrophomonadaceae bacterium]
MPVTVFNPIQDVYISSAYPNQNFANATQGNVLFIGTFTGAADIYRSLLQFDVVDANHGIPPNSTISEANLVLHIYRNDNPGTAQVNGFRLLDFFHQKKVTFNTAPENSSINLFSIVPSGAAQILDINITSLVQGWYSGAIPNNGILLEGLENANDNIIGFRSTRFDDSSFWPSLSVTWAKGTLSAPISETLSGAPKFTTFVNMAGKEQATWLIYNPTTTALTGVVQVVQGNLLINDPNTVFTVPAAGNGVVYFTGAVDSARLAITAASATDTYTISVETRDE